MAGCFYSLLIWDMLLQAAQQFSGMLTAFKSHCKQGFWTGDLITCEISISSLAHSNGYITCSRRVSLLLFLYQFNNLFFSFASVLTQK